MILGVETYRGYDIDVSLGGTDIWQGGHLIDRTTSADEARKIIDQWLDAK